MITQSVGLTAVDTYLKINVFFQMRYFYIVTLHILLHPEKSEDHRVLSSITWMTEE